MARELGHRCVRDVRQRDHAQPATRQPPHRRAVAGEPAGVRHHRAQLVLELHPQPVPVAGRRPHAAERAPTDVALHGLHLPPRCARQRPVFGSVAGGERVVEPRDPAGDVGDGGPDTAHRCDEAVARCRDLLHPPVVEPAHRPRPSIVVGLHPRAAGHTQRCEQALADHLLDTHARCPLDHPAEHCEPEVRVLVRHTRGFAERTALADDPVELLVGQVEMAVGPRVVGDETARHRQQVAHADRRRVRAGGAQPVEGGVVHAHRIVEPQYLLVAQQQRRCGGERLGHRRDPVHGVLVDVLIAGADRAGERQRAVAHHAPRHRRAMVLGGVAGHERVEGAAVDRHRPSLAWTSGAWQEHRNPTSPFSRRGVTA